MNPDYIATASAAGAKGGGLYRVIFLRLLWASPMLSGLVALFLLGLVATSAYAGTPVATIFVGSVSMFVVFMFGFGLGYLTSGLWGQDSHRLVPGYHRRLMRVVAGTALAVWGVLALSQGLARVDHGIIPWVDGVWLWSYGLLGLSFIWGFFATRKVHWLARTAMVSLVVLPWALSAHPSLRQWLFHAYAPYTPAVVLSLLLGPHNWPLLFARRMPAAKPGMQLTGLARAELRSRAGTAFDGIILQELLQRLHGRSTPRPEFLVFPAAVVGALWGPLVGVAICGFVLANTNGGVGPEIFDQLLLPLVMVLATILPLSAPVTRRSLGRYVLLPGAVHRRELPAWLARRHFAVTAGAAAILWLPSLLVAIAAGVPAETLARFVAAYLLALVAATALQTFLLPGRTGSPGYSGVRIGLPIGAAMIGSVAGGAVVHGTDLWSAGSAAVAAAVVMPIVLQQWGLRRARTIDLGS